MGQQRYSFPILDPITRGSCMVSFTLWPLYSWGKGPWYPSNRCLGGPQNRYERCGVEKNPLPLPGNEWWLSRP
jgi:hypothetical protein